MRLWQRSRIAAALQIAAIIFCSTTSPLAEQLLRSPSSIDPILRNVSLEKERVRPEPAPGISISPIAGKQTVILHAAHEKPDGLRSPLVVLRIPSEFFLRPSVKPIEVFGVNLLTRYPSMTRHVEQIYSCNGWCEGKILIGLESRRSEAISFAASRMNVIREDIARQRKMSAPLVSYTSIAAPSDYDEAIDVIYNKLSGANRHKRYFVKNGSGGLVDEFVECHPKDPSPACTFIVSFPDLSAIQIRYTHSVDLWSERRKVQTSVIELVRKFYEREIPR